MRMAEVLNIQVSYEYRELTEPTKEQPESGDEIALKVIKTLGLEVKTDGFNEVESDISA